MQFGQIIPHLLCTIFHSNPRRGPVFVSKINLSDAHMRVWIFPENLPQLAFVVPPHPSDQNILIGFHLSLPMGHVYSTPYFLCANKIVANLANQS